MKLLLAAAIILLLINSLCSLYLLFLGMFGIKVQQPPKSNSYNRFAILVPVHNEVDVITVLIDSLKKLDYQSDLYDCYFGADHCSDDTASKIINSGYICYEKNDGLPGKGRMMSYLTKKVLEENKGRYDAFVYFDADDYVEADFLKVINDSLNAGNEVVQGNSAVLNWNDSVFSAINHINVSTTNRLKENARKNAGLSCFLRGHAMCFKTSILEKFDWPVESIVEDENVFLKLMLQDRTITWEHNAKVKNRIFTSMGSAAKQRIRWSGGRINNIRENGMLMLKNFAKKRNWSSLDALLVLLMPTYSILVAVSIFLWLTSLLFLRSHIFLFWWSSVIAGLWALYFFMGAILEKIPLKVLLYFFVSPVFIFWRTWIYLISLTKMKTQEWR